MRVVYVSSNTLGKVLILCMLYTWCIWVAYQLEMGQFRMCCKWIKFIYFFLTVLFKILNKTPKPQNPLNLKNPASQMTPQCHIKLTHNIVQHKWHPGHPRTPKKNILCFTLVEVQMRGTSSCLKFLLLVILGQLLVSCKGWEEGGSAELQPSQRGRIWAESRDGAGVDG